MGTTMPDSVLHNTRPSRKTFVTLMLCFLFCALIIHAAIHNKMRNERHIMEAIVAEKALEIHTVLTKLLFKAQVVSGLVIQSDGNVTNFRQIASAIVDAHAIRNILLAPKGIVSDVYPLEGNERLVGYNLFGEGYGNREARMAAERGEIVFGGPFDPMQGGGQILGGRIPVFLTGKDGSPYLWGIVSITLRSPEALEEVQMESVRSQGFAYAIWRINPDTGKRQFILQSDDNLEAGNRYVEKEIRVMNARWFLRVGPVHPWYSYPECWLMVAMGVCISILVAYVSHKNAVLQTMRNELEVLVNMDTLTGVLNRKGLFSEVEKHIGKKKRFHLYYIDLNYFKQVNDTFGHNAGDQVLVEFCARVQKHLNGTEIFARIGGDEFVLIKPCDNARTRRRGDATSLWMEVLKEFECPIAPETCGDLRLSFSLGKAVHPDDDTTIDGLIAHADKRMYEQKRALYHAEKRRRSGDWSPERAGDRRKP